MPSAGVVPLTLRNLQGINRRDGGELMADNQFFRLQNWYFATKGLLYKRPGSTNDVAAASIPGANKITGLHRHYGMNREKYSLYFCEPNSSDLPDNTTDLTLAEINGGDLFNGGAVETMRFCYSWIGWGQEQTYNTKNRASFVALPTNAWTQTAHQSITVSANTKGVRVTVPAFPSGVRGANIFAARGTNSQMTYMGTVTTSGGTLDVLHYIAATAASNDAATFTVGRAFGGTLKKGTYYVSVAWVVNPGGQEGALPSAFTAPTLKTATAIVLNGESSAITVALDTVTSTNGAKAVYVFVGSKSEKEHPMVFCGIIKNGETLTINSIPDNTNAQSHPDLGSSDTQPAVFQSWCKASSAAITSRLGFVIKKDSGGTLSEVFPSRTIVNEGATDTSDPIYGGTTGVSNDQFYYLGYPRSTNDKWSGSQPYNWGKTVYEPQFAYFNGLSYFVNGVDIPWQTDGKSMGQIARKNGTLLPPFPRFITVFENSLLVAGAEARNQVFGCNANDPQNWAAGGTGTAKRFVSLGDLFGDECSALGVFSLATDAVNDPRSYFVGFKKHGVWMKDTFPDPTSGVGAPMEQLSGRVGCIAYRSIASTPRGVIFVGHDGNVYLIRGSGEPVAIGGSVKPLLEHLATNDSLMQKVTAVYHDDHYKLSYPSSSSSTYNDAQLWADLRTEGGFSITWVGPHTGISVGPQIALIGESDDGSRLACLGSGNGTVKLDDITTYQDLGSAIASIIESKTFRFKAEMHFKRFMGLLAEAYFDTQYSHSLLMEAFAGADYSQNNKTLSTGGATWDGSNYDTAAKFSDADFQLISWMFGDTNLVGRTFKFKLTHSSNAPFVISTAAVLYKPERRLIA